MQKNHYVRLIVMAVLSFLSMYVLMYAMVDALRNVHHNLNQAYMAALMAAPMVALELVTMRGMYRNQRLNAILLLASLGVMAGAFFLIRRQVAIGDRQFLRSMIPHHAGAILMCEEASLEDQEILRLCESIRASQQAEIDQMKRMLERLGE